jgi:hypothetical protein
MPDRRLQPPPRVPAAGSAGPNGDPPGKAGRSNTARRIGSSVLFGTLIVGLIGVFFILPRWQEGRGETRADTVPIDSTDVPQPSAIPPVESPPAPTMTVTPRPAPTAVIQPTRLPEAPAPTRGPSRAERDYRGAMSEGLEALESERWEEARSALEGAARLKPGAPEVADALARVAAGQRREAISASIQRALELERGEAWHEAEETYTTVLTMDPEAAEALAGHERASYRADLDEKLEYHIRNPGRLTSPVVLEDASALIEEVRGVSPGGPRVTDQLNRLEHLVETASTPIPVILESDNLTEIMVLRVGRLGAFNRHELSLRPGTYTAVGSRAGFRDIRVRFVVAPGATNKPVAIRCKGGI